MSQCVCVCEYCLCLLCKLKYLSICGFDKIKFVAHPHTYTQKLRIVCHLHVLLAVIVFACVFVCAFHGEFILIYLYGLLKLL